MNDDDDKQEKIKSLLRKSPQDRLPHEILYLSHQLSSFFSNYIEILSEELYLEIFRTLSLESYKKFSSVFHYGDLGKKIYYILKGEAYVLVPKIYDVNEHSALILSNIHKSLLPTNEAEILHSNPSFLIRTTLKQGYNFGEVALIIKGCRNSTIVCKEDCDLMVMNAETYHKINKRNLHNIYSDKMEFLTEIAMFNQWRRTNISLVMFFLKELSMLKDQYIYKENDEVSGIYIIYEGEIEIFKSFAKSMSHINMKVSHKRLISVGKLLKGQTFGEEEIFSKNERVYYAKCISINTKLLFFTKKDLFDNIKSRVYLDNMKRDAEIKIEYRENFLRKKLELLNFFKNKKVPKPINQKIKDQDKINNNSKSEFNSRSNIILNYVSVAEKLKESKQEECNEFVQYTKEFSFLLKNSVISNKINSIPKYKNKVLSFQEKKTLEKNYDSDLTNKIRTLVEKRIEGNLTDRPIVKKQCVIKLKRTKSSDGKLHKRNLSAPTNWDKNKEVPLHIKSLDVKDKEKKAKRVFRSFHFQEEIKKNLIEKYEKSFVHNFLIKKK